MSRRRLSPGRIPPALSRKDRIPEGARKRSQLSGRSPADPVLRKQKSLPNFFALLEDRLPAEQHRVIRLCRMRTVSRVPQRRMPAASGTGESSHRAHCGRPHVTNRRRQVRQTGPAHIPRTCCPKRRGFRLLAAYRHMSQSPLLKNSHDCRSRGALACSLGGEIGPVCW